jgi:hypothetical protein
MVLIKEEVPVDMVQYHEAPTVRPDRPAAVPPPQPYTPTPLAGPQENYEYQFQVPGYQFQAPPYNPFGSSDEASSPRPASARYYSADSDDTASNHWTPASSRAPSEQPVLREQNWAQGYVVPAGITRAGAAAQGVNLPGPALCDYQMQLMLLKQQNIKRLVCVRANQNDQSGSFDSRVMQLERANNARLVASRQRQEQDAQISAATALSSQEEFMARRKGTWAQGPIRCMRPELERPAALQDYNTQLRLLEQQNKKRLFIATQEQDGVSIRCRQVDGMHSQQQFLERNERPNMYAQHEGQQDNLPAMNVGQEYTTPRDPILVDQALQDYRMELMRAEQRIKEGLRARGAQLNEDQVQQHACPAISEVAVASVNAYSEGYAQLDVETQCAVVGTDGMACRGLLSCENHGWSAKRAVCGRSAPFDQLLDAQQANAAAVHDKAFELRGPRPDQEPFF